MSASEFPYYQKLDNGITVIVTPNPTTNIIAGRVFVRVGNLNVPIAGLSHLVAALLTKGTTSLSALEVAERIESLGAGLSAEANQDNIELSIKAVTPDFPEILRLVGDLLRNAQFAPPQIELERRLTLQSIRSQAERPLTLALQQLREMIYHSHPYAQPLLGTVESVQSITQEDLVNFYQTYFRPDRLIISLAGCITPTTAIQLVADILGDWTNPATPVPTVEISAIPQQPQRQMIDKPTQQSIVMLGHLGAAVSNPHYPTLRLINTYLGSGISSRLFVELREKRGLAYEVSSFYSTKIDRAIFAVYMGTTPAQVPTAINGLQGEVARLCVTKLSGEELATAKSKLLGKYALGKQTGSQMAYIYGWYEALGMGWEFDRQFITAIEAITPHQIEEVANQYFSHPYYLSVVGPQPSI